MGRADAGYVKGCGMRIIDLTVDNEHIKGSGVTIGAAGSHDAVGLRFTFSGLWDGLTKRVLWIDARGTTRTETILTSDHAESENVYVVPVPASPLQYAGKMSVTLYGVEISGADEVLKVVTEAVYFPIMTSFYDAESDPDGPLDIDPTIADQLQAEIDDVLDDILDARAAADDAEAWAVGQIDGADVPMTDPRFHNNSKFYAEQAYTAGQTAASEAIALVRDELTGYVEDAEDARDAIYDMSVVARTLSPGSDATVTKSVDASGAVTLTYGIPQGAKGDTGPQGVQGLQGERGVNGVAVATEGAFAFNVDEDGHLILYYTGDTAPDFEIDDDGHLILNI